MKSKQPFSDLGFQGSFGYLLFVLRNWVSWCKKKLTKERGKKGKNEKEKRKKEVEKEKMTKKEKKKRQKKN